MELGSGITVTFLAAIVNTHAKHEAKHKSNAVEAM